MSPLFQPLKKYLETQQSKIANIGPDRKKVLDSFSQAILHSLEAKQKANLLFVCTQNSRRSQISQAFAAAIPQYFDLPGIKSFSGGTTVSEFHPNAIQALESCGFRIENQGPPRNPKYSIRWADGTPSLLAFSKKFQEQPNPASEFVAIFVCSQADESCPYVSGAEARISLPYEDPKSGDNSENPLARYLQTCEQIASELLYTFEEVKQKL
ncbi:hypothetical protein EHO59_01205 [Leptospira semungkisensis]|uniref:Phosphotyrosine protein phosphatase I domain-containing protein n=1 Tax=Leptospira semungkisensis TaxID=2484985 RepID=A0A4R9G5V9_9LEPT|nr:hypothetical protein [Leptospira semungkisensis]TGK06783.1 hypothetical protein EHO59_01205 [Leptospira semungkisensis]